jgi:hypothetical protein
MQNNIYKTRDIAEAAALLTCKQRLIKIDKLGNTCIFNFFCLEECEKISNDFYFGTLMVNARTFMKYIKN